MQRVSALTFVLLLTAVGTLHSGDYTFLRLAGSPGAFDAIDGPVADAAFPLTGTIACSDEAIYVGGLGTFRRIAGGEVTSVAATVQTESYPLPIDGVGANAVFYAPSALVLDGGYLWVMDGSAMRRLTLDGAVKTIEPHIPLRSDGGAAGMGGLARDRSGMFFLTDVWRHVIWKATIPPVVFAGGLDVAGYVNGLAADARFYSPRSIVLAPDGTMYVGDANAEIRRITPGGDVSLLAGRAGDHTTRDGIGFDAGFTGTYAIALAPDGTLLVADGRVIRRVTAAGEVTTISDQISFLDGLRGICSTASGTIYATTRAGVVRLSDGHFEPVAGSEAFWSNPAAPRDGRGAEARFAFPGGVAFDDALNAYLLDAGDPVTLRKLAADGTVTTIPISKGIWNTRGLASGPDGSLFAIVGGAVDRIAPDGTVTILAGGEWEQGAVDGAGELARFASPVGIARSADGNIFVADWGNHAIRKITPDGIVSTFAGSLGVSGDTDGARADARFTEPYEVGIDQDETLWVTDQKGLRHVAADGSVTTVGDNVTRSYGRIAVGAAGIFTVSTSAVALISRDGTRTQIAGATDGDSGLREGTGTGAMFADLQSIAVDSSGRLLVYDGRARAFFAGTPAIPDRAVATPAAVLPGAAVQLGVQPKTAARFEWRQIRRPSVSSARLSATDIPNPTFTPDVADTYIFELRATTATGASISRVTVKANEVRPAASFNAPDRAATRNTVAFTDSSSGRPAAWAWNFGDGTGSDEPSPKHAYQNVGTYTVTLTVSNGAGNSSATKQIVVSQPTRRRGIRH